MAGFTNCFKKMWQLYDTKVLLLFKKTEVNRQFTWVVTCKRVWKYARTQISGPMGRTILQLDVISATRDFHFNVDIIMYICFQVRNNFKKLNIYNSLAYQEIITFQIRNRALWTSCIFYMRGYVKCVKFINKRFIRWTIFPLHKGL